MSDSGVEMEPITRRRIFVRRRRPQRPLEDYRLIEPPSLLMLIGAFFIISLPGFFLGYYIGIATIDSDNYIVTILRKLEDFFWTTVTVLLAEKVKPFLLK